VNTLAYGNAPAVMMKYVKPSADGVIGVPLPQVPAGRTAVDAHRPAIEIHAA
jgi:hypothetical protein